MSVNIEFHKGNGHDRSDNHFVLSDPSPAKGKNLVSIRVQADIDVPREIIDLINDDINGILLAYKEKFQSVVDYTEEIEKHRIRESSSKNWD